MDKDQEAFDTLLLRLEKGLPNSRARYERLRLKMTRFFEWKRCQDAPALADETIARAVRQILDGKEILAENPYYYLFGIANNVYKGYIKAQVKNENIAKVILEQQVSPSIAWHDCRVECLGRLSPESRALVERYYRKPDNRASLAVEYGLTLTGLRLRIHRHRKDLKECYDNCRKKGSN